MKKIIFRIAIVAVIAGAVYGGYRALQQLPERQQQIATARVRRGDVVVRSYTRGELRAVRSVTLSAPNLFGTVQVTRIAPLGALAREKDLVAEFDDSEVQSRLEEKQLEIDQVDQQIGKAEADLAVRNNQDQVDLLKARYAVRRAELEVKRNELLSTIDARKNDLTLKETNQRLKQLESDIKSRLEQAEAQMAVLRESKNKALLELSRERQRLLQVKLLSPITGLVAIRQNRGGGFFYAGMQLPDIREGDQLQPGMPVVDVLDLSELEVIAKVGELDRANLNEGQDVNVGLDAIPEKRFHGKIKSLSGMASASVFSNDPQKKFDVVFSIDMEQLLTALGARPEQIRRIMATAEQNRKKPVALQSTSMFAAGGMPGGGPMTMVMAAPGAGSGGGGGGAPGGASSSSAGEGEGRGARRGGGEGGGRGGERPRQFGFAGPGGPSGATGIRVPAGGASGGSGPTGATGMRLPAGGPSGGSGPVFFTRGGGPGGGAPPAGMPAGFMLPGPGGMTVGGFSEKELAAAKLPPPPEEDTQLDVLIRPGLLVDIEIIVEKIPDAIHVPTQAVFDKDGKMVVYVKNGSRWDERTIKPLKRSESTLVVADGVKPGELIAMSDPTAKKGDKKGDSKKTDTKSSGGGGPLPGGGGSGGGARGGF